MTLMIKKRNQIWVTFQKEGIHCYPAALDDPKLDITIFVENVNTHPKMDVLELDYKSCEMISDELAEKINEKYPGRKVTIEVSEDGENGSISSYIPNAPAY